MIWQLVQASQGNYYSCFTQVLKTPVERLFHLDDNSKHTLQFGVNYFFHTLFSRSYSSDIPKSGNWVKLDPDLVPKNMRIKFDLAVEKL